MGHVTYSRTRTKRELEEYSLKQLRQIAHDRFAVANKRIKRLEQSGTSSPALNALIKKRGENPRFTQGGKNIKQLTREIAECYSFLNLETSTVTGTKNYERHVADLVGTSSSDKKRISQMFRLFDALQERLPGSVFGNVHDTNQEMEQLRQIVDSRSDLDLSQMEMNANQKEEIVSKAIDKMLDEIEEEKRKGEESLESIEKQFRRLF